MKLIEGGVLAAKGFKAGSVAAGIKKKKLDMTVLFSEYPAVVAGAFTTNVVKAAPVWWDKHIVEAGHCVRALVANSGNANACTGEKGTQDTQRMAAVVAELLGAESHEVLVCSTGVIGVPLPMEKIEAGIGSCVAKLDGSLASAKDSAAAICTTDTFSKEVSVELSVQGKTIRIGGMAKGSGMIHPDMATMLSFITTDANVEPAYLQKLLGSTVVDSYNMISVDGDTSTNDTVLVLANGASNSVVINAGVEGEEEFAEAFLYVHTELAKLIVLDGEGAGKFIEMTVSGAKTKEDARLIARSAISSSLVKAAFFGADANWGRILCAMGYSKASFDPEAVTVTYTSDAGTITVLEHGSPIAFDESYAKKVLREKVIRVQAQVGDGTESAIAWGCDLTYEYVRINGDYRS